MRQRIIVYALFVGVLIWGTVLIAALGIVQRPLYADVTFAMLHHLATIGVAMWVVVAGTGIGFGVLRLLKLPATDTERWLIAAISGIGFLGTLWLWMGLVRLPPLPLTIAILIAGVILFVWQRPPFPALPRLPLPAGLFIGATVGLAFVRALLPPISYDALLYHLRLPELWLHYGTLFQPQKEAPFFFPVLVEAIFTPAFQFGTPSAPQLIHWAFLLLLAGLMWQFTRRYLPSVTPSLVLVLILSIQMIPLLAGWAYTDLFFAAFQIGVVWALLQWRESKIGRWVVLAGIFAGLTMGVKYLAAFTPVLAVGMIAISERRQWRTALQTIMQFSVVALLVAAPSYLRNTIATGNPLFPFALPGIYWDDYRAAWYAASGTGIGWSLTDLVALPFTVTLALGDTSYYDGRPGALIATFIPLALGLFFLGYGQKQERTSLVWLLYFAGAYITVWVLGIINSAGLQQGRFLVTPLVLLCPLVAWGIETLKTIDIPRFAPSRVALLIVGLWAGFSLWISIGETVALDPVNGLFAPDKSRWLAERPPGYQALVAQVNALPATNRVQLWYEPRSYGMSPATLPDTLLYEFTWRLQRVNRDVAEIDNELCQAGISHVAVALRGADFLFEESIVNPITAEEYNALQAWMSRHEQVWADGAGWYELYTVGCGGD
jgi:hypothetical protein